MIVAAHQEKEKNEETKIGEKKQIKGYFEAIPIVYDMYKLTFVLILKKLNFKNCGIKKLKKKLKNFKTPPKKL